MSTEGNRSPNKIFRILSTIMRFLQEIKSNLPIYILMIIVFFFITWAVDGKFDLALFHFDKIFKLAVDSKFSFFNSIATILLVNFIVSEISRGKNANKLERLDYELYDIASKALMNMEIIFDDIPDIKCLSGLEYNLRSSVNRSDIWDIEVTIKSTIGYERNLQKHILFKETIEHVRCDIKECMATYMFLADDARFTNLRDVKRIVNARYFDGEANIAEYDPNEFSYYIHELIKFLIDLESFWYKRFSDSDKKYKKIFEANNKGMLFDNCYTYKTNLRRVRFKAGYITDEELARKTGIEEHYYRLVENRRAKLTTTDCCNILKALGEDLKFDDLFCL